MRKPFLAPSTKHHDFPAGSVTAAAADVR